MVQTMDGTHGVANRGFNVFSAGLDHFHGRLHITNIVEGVKNPKDINAVFRREFNEFL